MNTKFRLLTIAVITTANLIIGAESAYAQGEHSRRAATEIRVIIGDLQRLQAPDTLAIHKVGLIHRIQGGLAALDILLRLADQENGNPIAQYREEVINLSEWISNSEFDKANFVLDQWQERYPLDFIELSNDENVEHELARKLHQDLCAGCHDNPVVEVERPAYNLFDEANKLEYSEFLARLFVGVRGDRVTGIDNPFSDYEIAALINFYSNSD